MKTIAQKIADHILDTDGTPDDWAPILDKYPHDTIKACDQVHGLVRDSSAASSYLQEAARDNHFKRVFADRSVIVEIGQTGAWDIGYDHDDDTTYDCYCWQAVGHQDGCRAR